MQEPAMERGKRDMGNNGSYCRKCGQRIVWIKTVAGKHMPCDRVLIPYWIPPRRTGRERFVTEEGKVVAAERSPGARIDGEGYIPHFATCPAGQ